jgi:hypothetical protein
MIVESMAENENGGVKATSMGGLSLGYGVAKDKVLSVFNKCIELGLFFENEGYYYSKRLLEHKKKRKELSEYGSLGAKKKWGGYSHPNAKERKGKENIKGVFFSADKESVILSDNSIQELGLSQKSRVKYDDIKPDEIYKGLIV